MSASGGEAGIARRFSLVLTASGGDTRELEAEAPELLPRLRVIGLRVRSRPLLSVEIKSASPLDPGRGCKLEDGEGAFLDRAPRRANAIGEGLAAKAEAQSYGRPGAFRKSHSTQACATACV
jgi:hypothetical protein